MLIASVVDGQVVAPAAAKQWNVANEEQLRYGVEYWLFNGSSRIGYLKRPTGLADLAWTSSGGNFQLFRKADFATAPGEMATPPPIIRDHRVRPVLDRGEKVAIFNTKKKGFLKYYDRGTDDLTELTFAPGVQPIYDWEFRDLSVSGGRVHFALWNVTKQRYLVRRATTDGIGLGWYSESPTPPTDDAFLSVGVEPFAPGSEYRQLRIRGSGFLAGEIVTLQITTKLANQNPFTESRTTAVDGFGHIDFKYSGSGGGVCDAVTHRTFQVQGTGGTSNKKSNLATSGC